MHFIDEVEITVSSGSGGNGAVSFRREKFIPKGGPDGGNGGNGGNVYFLCKNDQHTLSKFRGKKNYAANNGQNGSGSKLDGKSGKDLILIVPEGTIISSLETNDIIVDFSHEGQIELLAKGGRGGLGNTYFKSATNQAPKFAMPGEDGSVLKLKLELKLIADIALIGMPNAGKSTLISVISNAKPKIADYPFTTLQPNLGVVEFNDFSFTVADIPGLIEGASIGKGLGIQFLKHIERSKMLVHLVDASESDPFDAYNNYVTIRNELASYSPTLSLKKELVILTKIDAINDLTPYIKLFEKNLDKQVLSISSISGKNIDFLIKIMAKGLK